MLKEILQKFEFLTEEEKLFLEELNDKEIGVKGNHLFENGLKIELIHIELNKDDFDRNVNYRELYEKLKGKEDALLRTINDYIEETCKNIAKQKFIEQPFVGLTNAMKKYDLRPSESLVLQNILDKFAKHNLLNINVDHEIHNFLHTERKGVFCSKKFVVGEPSIFDTFAEQNDHFKNLTESEQKSIWEFLKSQEGEMVDFSTSHNMIMKEIMLIETLKVLTDNRFFENIFQPFNVELFTKEVSIGLNYYGESFEIKNNIMNGFKFNLNFDDLDFYCHNTQDLKLTRNYVDVSALKFTEAFKLEREIEQKHKTQRPKP